jgi:hypothetical protein
LRADGAGNRRNDGEKDQKMRDRSPAQIAQYELEGTVSISR